MTAEQVKRQNAKGKSKLKAFRFQDIAGSAHIFAICLLHFAF